MVRPIEEGLVPVIRFKSFWYPPLVWVMVVSWCSDFQFQLILKIVLPTIGVTRIFKTSRIYLTIYHFHSFLDSSDHSYPIRHPQRIHSSAIDFHRSKRSPRWITLSHSFIISPFYEIQSKILSCGFNPVSWCMLP